MSEAIQKNFSTCDAADASFSQVTTGYRRTHAGVIPENWTVKSLGDIFTLKPGFAFKSEYFSLTGPIVLTPGNFRLDGGLYFEHRNTKHYSGSYSPDMTFTNGDLLIVMTDLTPDCNLLGKPAFVESDEIVLHNQRIGKVVFKDKFTYPLFLFFVLLSRSYMNRIKEAATGSTVRHTSNKSIYDIQIAWPELAEQRCIAEALSDVDELLGALEALIAKKRAIKLGVMQQLLTGKTRLPGFSAVWETRHIGSLLGVKHGRSQAEVSAADGPYPILATGGLIGRASAFLHENPSVLIGRKGTIDRPQFIDVPFWTVDTLFYTDVYRPNSAKFLFYRFCLIDWSRYNEASGVPSLNARTIEAIEVEMPGPVEQTQIAEVLSNMDAEIAALETRRDKTRAIKQGMMQQLLTGRIRLVKPQPAEAEA